MMTENKIIRVNGYLFNRRARIVIKNPISGDVEYAKETIKIWNQETAFMLKGNMEIEWVGTDWGKRFNDSFPVW